MKRLFELEERLERVKRMVPTSRRRDAFQIIFQIETEIDEMRKICARQVEEGFKSSDVLSRFQALKFRGRMSKARREKDLDKRGISVQFQLFHCNYLEFSLCVCSVTK
jgi:hypothetical protein